MALNDWNIFLLMESWQINLYFNHVNSIYTQFKAGSSPIYNHLVSRDNNIQSHGTTLPTSHWERVNGLTQKLCKSAVLRLRVSENFYFNMDEVVLTFQVNRWLTSVGNWLHLPHSDQVAQFFHRGTYWYFYNVEMHLFKRPEYQLNGILYLAKIIHITTFQVLTTHNPCLP